jgi:hypothetical protein
MIIGVTGYKGSGKNEIGRILEQWGFYQVALADTVKSMALAINPIVRAFHFPKHPERLATVVSVMGWEKAKENPEVRGILQRLGTEGGRAVLGPYVWINALEQRLDNLRAVAKEQDDWQPDFVVTDVRFPNEALWIQRNLEGQVWRVNRPGCESDGHASESSVDLIDPDVVIDNDGTLDDLAVQVTAAMGL